MDNYRCSACKQEKPKGDFSNTQLKKKPWKRKCKQCTVQPIKIQYRDKSKNKNEMSQEAVDRLMFGTIRPPTSDNYIDELCLGHDEIDDIETACVLREIMWDILDTNTKAGHEDIIAIIMLYNKPFYANLFNAETDQDYKQKAKLGDILKTNVDGKGKLFVVLDANGDHAAIIHGDWRSQSEPVPLKICKHFENAVAFYSQIMERSVDIKPL